MEPKSEKTPPAAGPQNLILEDRGRLTVTGVSRMLSCDENAASMETARGVLTLEGRQLSVSTLSLETGEVRVTGQIDALSYADTAASGGGFWHRLVR